MQENFPDEKEDLGLNQEGVYPNQSQQNFNPYNMQNYNGNYSNNEQNFPPEFDQCSDYDVVSYFEKQDREKKDIRFYGNLIGCALITTILLQNLLVIILTIFGCMDLFMSNSTFFSGANIVISIITILGTFWLFGKTLNKHSKQSQPINYDLPKNKKLLFLSLPAGLGVCMVANIITSYFVQFFSFFGVQLDSPDMPTDTTWLAFILLFIQVAVVAPLVEEISLRGFTMGNLRQFGPKFAIFISAYVFGILHGNLVQAPFALIVGIILGYICIKTSSIWTAILVHALNNMIAVIVTQLMGIFDETLVSILYALFMYATIAIGLICLVLFVKEAKRTEVQTPPLDSTLTLSTKIMTFLFSPGMIFATLILVTLVMSSYISIG